MDSSSFENHFAFWSLTRNDHYSAGNGGCVVKNFVMLKKVELQFDHLCFVLWFSVLVEYIFLMNTRFQRCPNSILLMHEIFCPNELDTNR